MQRVFATLMCLCLADFATAADVDYQKQVKPILGRCFSCHGAVRQKAKLRLDAVQLLRKGGRSGPAVIPGKSGESILIAAVLGKDLRRMPPESEGAALKESEIALLRAWIDQGARAADEPVPEDPRNHWAFKPPVRLPAPVGEGKLNPVDAFVAAERTRHGLTPNLPASKPLLLRRVYLDLVGLPPTREELHAFLADLAPDAYEKVVDRLLASPRYGERWGRHWMDVWRYSDPFGLGEEYRYSQRHIWRWRDWIIESLNADKGYDRMIVEMLAGDEIAPADRDTLRATGYLARNWYKFNRNVWIQDTVEYTSAGFLGLTLRCARCHDHKYDPIAQQDYYRFRAFFEPHDVRIDPLPRQPDPLKDGVARAFDAKPEALTYVFARGDERMPVKDQPLAPGVPPILGGETNVTAIKFTTRDFAAGLESAAQEALTEARVNMAAAEAGVKAADNAVAAARRRLEQIAAGAKPTEAAPPALLADNFTTSRPDTWKVVRGQWGWEKCRLMQKTPTPFATIASTRTFPLNLMGRVRYRTTGGGVGSVGFSFDADAARAQCVYTATSAGSVQAFHRVGGVEAYPAAGIFKTPLKLNEVITLDFAVRGSLLNVWVNGTLRIVYHLPLARQSGQFHLWNHDATSEFLVVRLAALPDNVPLAEKLGEDRKSPLSGPVIATKADAERALVQTQKDAALITKKRATAKAVLAAVEARLAADRAAVAEPPDTSRQKALALAAGKAERQAAVVQAEEALARAEQAGAAKKAAAAAKKALEAARAAAAKDNPSYTPLITLTPAASTGRRLALAKWITDRNNPLTARVAVNHMWMRHFGKPLVASVANFGLAGKKPTHPELLDWLAVELMESNWSMKKLHRLMVTSEAYRLSSQVAANDPRLAADAENHFLWRMNTRRMEGEAVRDSVLAVAGRLDLTMGGPILDERLGQSSRRRSVYFRFNTEYKMQFLDQFDAASPTECYERRDSVIPQQALALHNSALALTQARHLAGVLSDGPAGASSSLFVTAAFEQVLGRPPSDAERQRSEQFLREQTMLLKDPTTLTPFPPSADTVPPASTNPDQRARENFIQVLFNHNDFVTVR